MYRLILVFMLCFKHGTVGAICTNRCEERLECNIPKVPLLLEACNRLTETVFPQEKDGLFLISYKPYGLTPQVYLNGELDDIGQEIDGMRLPGMQ